MNFFHFLRRGKKPQPARHTASVLPPPVPPEVRAPAADFCATARMISAQAQQVLLENARSVPAVYFIVDGSILVHIHGKWGQSTVKFRDGEAFGLILQESNDVFYSIVSEGVSIISELT